MNLKIYVLFCPLQISLTFTPFYESEEIEDNISDIIIMKYYEVYNINNNNNNLFNNENQINLNNNLNQMNVPYYNNII